MTKKLKKTLAIIVLLFAVGTWVFSLLKIAQFLNLPPLALGVADVGISVESSAKSEISGGEGKASMKVTTEVNGDKQEITSDKPGEIKITVEDGKTTKEVNISSPAPTPEPSAPTSPSPSPTPMVQKQFQQMENEFSRLWQDFLSRLSQLFGFHA